MSAGAALGAGFGLYEASARGNAMGGGLVGSTGDATANYYNPANLTECTNITVTVGASFINPFADARVDGVQQQKMNAGWFPPPHAYAAVPLTKDLVFGFGTYCEYGLGTKYDGDWLANWDTTETTIEQFTFNPNLAYKVTDWWSVAFGARMSYLTFENYGSPYMDLGPMTGAPLPAGFASGYGRSHIEGDDFNCGWVLGTQFKVTKDLSIGAVYRSRIRHVVDGDVNSSTPAVSTPAIPGVGLPAITIPSMNSSGDAKGKLILPSSATIGANYDFTEKFRGGASLTWTEWSTVDTITFKMAHQKKLDLGWHDAWRVGFGFEYDFTDDFCGRIGYNFDMDPSHKDHGTTMLPPGDRHIIGFGLGYKILDDLRIDLGYNFIIMESTTRELFMKNALTDEKVGQAHRFETDNAYSHIVALSLTYSF
jgi:long-chain fatty acid transport protein